MLRGKDEEPAKVEDRVERLSAQLECLEQHLKEKESVLEAVEELASKLTQQAALSIPPALLLRKEARCPPRA